MGDEGGKTGDGLFFSSFAFPAFFFRPDIRNEREVRDLLLLSVLIDLDLVRPQVGDNFPLLSLTVTSI
jgi:hypothetical protein